MLYQEIFERSIALLGEPSTARLRALNVLVIGVGGVGSWCAEALVRSGLGHLTIVDSDCVEPSNINRQLPAQVDTIGQPKVEVLARHFAAVNPFCEVRAIVGRYNADTAADYDLGAYDYVIDAIDDLNAKVLLINNATRTPGVTLLSSMGAARRHDPTRVAVAEFWKVQGCPLARALRTKFRRSGTFPARKFQCVYSPEPAIAPAGTLMPVTASFGLTLASLILRNL